MIKLTPSIFVVPTPPLPPSIKPNQIAEVKVAVSFEAPTQIQCPQKEEPTERDYSQIYLSQCHECQADPMKKKTMCFAKWCEKSRVKPIENTIDQEEIAPTPYIPKVAAPIDPQYMLFEGYHDNNQSHQIN